MREIEHCGVAPLLRAAVWEVFCGKQAWHGLHYGVVVERVVIQGERPPVPEDMPEELELLMRRCWDADPAKRPTFDQVRGACVCLVWLAAGGVASIKRGLRAHGWASQRCSTAVE